jgi:hypothetical protein
MIYKIKLLIATAMLSLLSACGGGGSDNSQQLYSCAGSVIPNSALVTSTCVPIQSTPAPNTDGMCCRQVFYTVSMGQQSAPSYVYSKVGANSCTWNNASYKCPP